MSEVALRPASAPMTQGLIPRSMNEAFQLAEMMAKGKMMPEHLRNAGDAMMVIEQAMRWNMSPFAVAQSTFNIKGKLLFAGTIVAAAIENSGAISGLMDYQFSGEGAARKVVVSAVRRGETEARTVEVSLKDAKTSNDIWNKQPDQQLVYHGARVWARRWTPGVMLGVYSPEEMPTDAFAGPTIEARAEVIPDLPPDAPPPPKPPSDALSVLRHKIEACVTHEDVEALNVKWTETIAKASAAGRPIGDMSIEMARLLFATKLDALDSESPQMET